MVEAYVVSAFSKEGKGGNKAGVVLDCSGLTEKDMLRIAAELKFSETVYVSKSEVADFHLRYFTPVDEVPLCGHATIATFSLMWNLKLLNKKDITIETLAGILTIEVSEDGLIMMQQNCPDYAEMLEKESLEVCVGKEFIAEQYPIQIVSTGLRDIMLPIRSRERLSAMIPNMAEITALSRKTDVVGIHAFALCEEGEITAYCRNFAPLYGIDEESATGTSNCALASYLYRHVVKKSQYIFEQGYEMGLASRIIVKIVADRDKITAVYVGGYGYVMEKRVMD